MAQPDAETMAIARQGRMLALVIAGTMLLWMAGQWIGARLGLDASYAFLFDYAAIAALIWSLYVAYGLLKRQKRAGK